MHLRITFDAAYVLIVSMLLACVSQEARALVHDESVLGEISGDRLNPTHLVLGAGVHSLIGTMGAFGDELEVDLEYVRIDLPSNHRLTNLRMQAFDSLDGQAFIGVQNGTTFSFSPDDAFSNIGNLLGYAHFGPGVNHLPGSDILPDIGMGAGAIGFVPPLDGPSYTFWIQQTGIPTNYQLDFVVTGVPEPAAGMLFLYGAAAMASVRRQWRTRERRVKRRSEHTGSST